MPRYLAVLICSLVLWVPSLAFALSLGDIDLKSALNQKFEAEIPVSTESENDIAALSVALASVDTFDRYGLERAAFLGDFEFEIVANGANGVVRVTSSAPVVEPFVTLLIEIGSAQGRLLREYTVLLDPPVFGEASAPAVEAASAGPTPAPAPVVKAPKPVVRTPDPVVRAPKPVIRPAPSKPAAAPSGDAYGPVQRDDTLWSIAGRYAENAGVNRNQAMVAIYRANPEAFIGNINRLKAGMILRIPDGDEFQAVSRNDAFAEVNSQNEAWRGRRSASAKESGTLRLVPPPEADEAAEPVGSARETGVAGTTGDADSEVLRGRVSQLEDELAESRRLIELRDQELQQLQESLARAEQPVDSVADESIVDESIGAPGESVTIPPVIEEPALEEPAPAVTMPGVTTKPTEEQSLIGELFTNIWLYVALGGVLIIALFLVRRRSAEPEAPAWSRFDAEPEADVIEEVAEATQQLAPPPAADDAIVVEESSAEATEQDQPLPFAPEAADIFATSEEVPETPLERTISTESPVNLDEADPIAEADFHMAYGLYDQAADLLSNSLNSEPGRNDLRLKLLEVYFIWENQGGFLREAQALHERIQDPADPDWSKVLIMGKQICPDEELFSGAPAASGVSGDMDFPLAEEGPLDGDHVGIDFDFSATGSNVEPGGGGLEPEGTGADLDFDMSEVDLGVDGDADDALDFDISEAEESTYVAEDFDASDNAPTMESPIEPPSSAGSALETPTMESEALEADSLDPTMESPIAPPTADATLETPTIESPIGHFEDESNISDQTAEIELDDLGLDLSGLDSVDDAVDDEVVSGEDGEEFADSPLAAETLQVEAENLDSLEESLEEALDETQQQKAVEDLLEIDANFQDAGDSDSTGEMPHIGDTEEQPALDMTAEQPAPFAEADSEDELIEPGEMAEDVDFDVGENLRDGDATTNVVPVTAVNGATQTELGTKLDLARAYIDMGDPDGAKSILNEVLEEAPVEQRQEAQKLLDDLDS